MRFLPAAIAVFFMLVFPALAQLAPAAPQPDTVVTVPVGTWLADLQGYIVIGMGVAVGWVFRWLPERMRAIMMTMQAEQLINKALAFAVNTVVGGLRDKVWTIDMRNEVLKKMTTYVLVHGASSVKTFIGPAAEIAEKGFARITPPVSASGMQQPSPLPEGPPPNFVKIGAEAQVDASIKGMQSA